MASLFKYIFVALFAFASYNEFVMMRRESAYNSLGTHTDRAAVDDVLGDPKYMYQCGSTETPPTFVPYIESMCKENTVQVYAYPLCRIPMRCRGWNYVAYDKNSKLASKYHLAN